MNPLNEVITIEKLTSSKDALGTPKTSWSELAEVRASVNQKTGSKGFDSDPQESIHSYPTIFFTRFIDDFGYNCRIKYDSEVYEIKSIRKIMRRKGFEISCLRKESNG